MRSSTARLIGVLFAGLFLNQSCDFFSTLFFPETQTTASIGGRILTVRSGQDTTVVPGAQIEADGKTTFSDGAGAFKIENIRTGEQTLKIISSGYVTRSTSIQVRLSNPPQDFFLKPELDFILLLDTVHSMEDVSVWRLKLSEAAVLDFYPGDGMFQHMAYTLPGTWETYYYHYDTGGVETYGGTFRYQPRLQISGAHLDTTLAWHVYVIQNHKPSLFLSAMDFTQGIAGRLNFVFSDPDAGEPWEKLALKVDWGDGSVADSGDPGQTQGFWHSYSVAPNFNNTIYSIIVYLKDAAGAIYSDTALVTAKNREPRLDGPFLSPDTVVSSYQGSLEATIRVLTVFSYLTLIQWEYHVNSDTIDAQGHPKDVLVRVNHTFSDTSLKFFEDTFDVPVAVSALHFDSIAPEYEASTIGVRVRGTYATSTISQKQLVRRRR